MIDWRADPTEQERLLTSVIQKLAADEAFSQTTALAHAYALRARACLELNKKDAAILDAQQAVQISTATPATLSMAFRTWVDAESQPTHKCAVLQKWYQAQPAYRTKLQREIQELEWVMIKNTYLLYL